MRALLAKSGLMAMAILAALPTPARPAAPAADLVATAEDRRDVLALALPAMWRRYVDRFVSPEGRVIDNGNGDISHSEGQGYALVLAAMEGDRETFERVLAWTEKHLYVGGDFAAWRWDPATVPGVTDPNNATDGDILIAWGLALAGRTFDDPSYMEVAERQIRAIHQHLLVDTPLGPALMPAATGFSADDFADGPVLNPSYWVFPALDLFAEVTPDLDWTEVSETGYRLIRDSRFGPLRLPTEWVALGSGEPAPAAEFPPLFGYNALRIPLYLALDDDAPRDLLEPFVGLWNPVDDIGPFVIQAPTGEAGAVLDGAGYKAAFALADCIAGHRRVGDLFIDDELYFPATLGLFALHKIREEYSRCL